MLCSPCILGGAQKQGQNHIRLPRPYLLGGPQVGGECYVTPTLSGVPIRGDKIRIGCLTLAFSGAHKWSLILCNAYALEGPQEGQNQN